MMTGNRLALIVGALLLVVILVAVIVVTQRDREQHDAEFLAQCHEAGYDAAKCRFFLTATGRMNGAAASQMMIEAATPK
jgi:hypothetical protein